MISLKMIFSVDIEQAGADITGQLQVRPMLYTLYIDINLRVVSHWDSAVLFRYTIVLYSTKNEKIPQRFN